MMLFDELNLDLHCRPLVMLLGSFLELDQTLHQMLATLSQTVGLVERPVKLYYYSKVYTADVGK
jgi:hypothetical protein